MSSSSVLSISSVESIPLLSTVINGETILASNRAYEHTVLADYHLPNGKTATEFIEGHLTPNNVTLVNQKMAILPSTKIIHSQQSMLVKRGVEIKELEIPRQKYGKGCIFYIFVYAGDREIAIINRPHVNSVAFGYDGKQFSIKIDDSIEMAKEYTAFLNDVEINKIIKKKLTVNVIIVPCFDPAMVQEKYNELLKVANVINQIDPPEPVDELATEIKADTVEIQKLRDQLNKLETKNRKNVETLSSNIDKSKQLIEKSKEFSHADISKFIGETLEMDNNFSDRSSITPIMDARIKLNKFVPIDESYYELVTSNSNSSISGFAQYKLNMANSSSSSFSSLSSFSSRGIILGPDERPYRKPDYEYDPTRSCNVNDGDVSKGIGVASIHKQQGVLASSNYKKLQKRDDVDILAITLSFEIVD